MGNRIVLVEGKNDKIFIDALILLLKCSNLKCENLNGTGNLEKKLTALKRQIKKDDIEKIGIIFDANSRGIRQRETQIDNCVSSAFGKNPPLQIEKYILNVNGRGELCTLLRAIRKTPSEKADCLESWSTCVREKTKEEIPAKEIDKIWMEVYHKYDVCDLKERKNARNNCSLEAILNKGSYDLDHLLLNDLKFFLRQLGSQ